MPQIDKIRQKWTSVEEVLSKNWQKVNKKRKKVTKVEIENKGLQGTILVKNSSKKFKIYV